VQKCSSCANQYLLTLERILPDTRAISEPTKKLLEVITSSNCRHANHEVLDNSLIVPMAVIQNG
jgi:hypothetical protein